MSAAIPLILIPLAMVAAFAVGVGIALVAIRIVTGRWWH